MTLTGYESSVLAFLAQRPEPGYLRMFESRLGPETQKVARGLVEGSTDLSPAALSVVEALQTWALERRTRALVTVEPPAPKR